MNKNLTSLFLLDENVVFLNHGSFGACPRPVFEAYQKWQLKLERQPVAFLDPDRGLSGWMRDARVALAGELGTAADNIVGVMNATYGLNAVAQSLELHEGDEILPRRISLSAMLGRWSHPRGGRRARPGMGVVVWRNVLGRGRESVRDG